MKDHPNARRCSVVFPRHRWMLFRKALIDFVVASVLAAAGVGVVVFIAVLVSATVSLPESDGAVADKSILSPPFPSAIPVIALVMWIVSTSTIWWAKLSNNMSCERLCTYHEVDGD